MKNRVFLAFVLFCCTLPAMAQDFEIVSVEHHPNDFAPRKEMKTDPEGRQCALLCIATQNIAPAQREGFSFEPDQGAYIVERATRDGEIWLWVSPKLKHLRVKHREWGQVVLHMQDHVSVVEALHVYKIVVKYNPPTPPENPTVNKQFLAFQITPVNAVLEVNGDVWSLDASGGASRYLDFGTYSYRVRASDYFPEEGEVTVNDPENTQIKTVTLKPDFAEVTLKVDADAEIWVNNQRKGLRTWTGQLGSGSYKMECRQTNHETSVTNMEITASMTGQTITLPAPKPIYGSLLVESTPNFCKLFIDGEEVGTTPKSVNEILIGTHEIKISKEGYLDHVETVTITKGEMATVNATLKEGSKDEETFTVNGVSFTMKLVEGGTFLMGAQKTNSSGQNYDIEVADDESPVHNVTLSSYYMGETEVTQALWKAVMGSNPSHFKGDNLPVEQVSWNDCQEFIRKLNQQTGRNFRLPTEAEWEYAARGKTQTSLYNGENIDIRGNNNSPNLDKLAWYSGNCGRDYTSSAGCDVANGLDISDWLEKQYNDSRGGTHPVGKKQPNAYGLYDMLGNVREWCSDMYDHYGSASQINPNPQSTSYSFRVWRGGSWYRYVWECRVSRRFASPPDMSDVTIGFRLCLSQ